MLIDSHCHLNHYSNNKDEFCLLSEKEWRLVDVSPNPDDFSLSLDLSNTYAHIYSVIGVHPFYYSKMLNARILDDIKSIVANHHKVVGIGEVGIDYKADISLDKQLVVFSDFVKLAYELDKPLVLHLRVKDLDNLIHIRNILDRFFGENYRHVVLHCFSFSSDILREFIDRNAFISFSLNILRGNKKIIDSLLACPCEKLLLETDSPYMKVGSRASTVFDIKLMYDFVAKLKKVNNIDELKKIVLVNFKEAFGVDI